MALVSTLTFLDTFVVGLINPIYPTLVQNALLGATLYAAVKREPHRDELRPLVGEGNSAVEHEIAV